MATTSNTKRQRVTDTKKNIRNAGVEVGVLSGTGSHPNSDNASVVEIAIWNEFGTWKKTGSRSGASEEMIPPRPFIQSTMDENREKYKSIVARLSKLVLAGKIDADTAAGIIGGEVQADIQKKIVELRTPPNKKSTIKKKGSDNPLFDDGHLHQSIKWRVIDD